MGCATQDYKKAVLCSYLTVLLGSPLWASDLPEGHKILRWKLKPGEVVELRRFADQNVKINGESLSRRIYHRVLLQVLDIKDKGFFEVSGLFRSHLMADSKNQLAWQELEEYRGNFLIHPRGYYVVPAGQYMPNIRHIPTFPEKDPADAEDPMTSGFRWNAPAEEVISSDYLSPVPVEVEYEYLGSELVAAPEGTKTLHKIRSYYQIQFENPKILAHVPRRLMGFVSGVWYWDEKEGIPFYAQENYNLIILYPQGDVHEFDIRHQSYFSKRKVANAMAKKKLIDKLRQGLPPNAKAGIDEGSEGIKITLPDIVFDYNSAEITPKNRPILEKIAELLRSLPEKELRILGHTDNIGSEEFNRRLSLERARVVAEFLAQRLKIPAERITYEGLGSRYPLVENDSEENRQKNRRVEIIILNN